MAVKYTPDQQRVIDTRDKNILVSAAAGSGKTAVLVERIIRKICDEEHPVDIDRLFNCDFYLRSCGTDEGTYQQGDSEEAGGTS